MSNLTIILAGICTQFHNGILPGIVHRAVFPQAFLFELGSLKLPDDNPMTYYFMPHLTFVTNGRPGTWVKALNGATLTIPNAIGPEYQFTGDDRFSLKTYVPNPDDLFPDDEVCLNKNANYANCYFDLDVGEFTSQHELDDGPRFTQVEIETDGDPHLLITKFGEQHGESIPIDSDTLVVTNLDYQTDISDIQFDFLMNYLTMRGGMPRSIVEKVPGLIEPQSVTFPLLGNRLTLLGQKISREGLPDDFLNLTPAGGIADRRVHSGISYIHRLFQKLAQSGLDRDPIPDNQSCSDSQYP